MAVKSVYCGVRTLLFITLLALSWTCRVSGWQYGVRNNYDCSQTDGQPQGHMLQGLTYDFVQPYTTNTGFNVLPSVSVYRAGVPLSITVTPVDPQASVTIIGFLFQAFDENSNRVGMWSSPAPNSAVPVRTDTCATNTSNTISHGNSLSIGTAPLVLTWTPPLTMGTGRVNFVCLTMWQYGFFWIYKFQMDEDLALQPPQNILTVQITSAAVLTNPPTAAPTTTTTTTTSTPAATTTAAPDNSTSTNSTTTTTTTPAPTSSTTTTTGTAAPIGQATTSVTLRWLPPAFNGNQTVSIVAYTIWVINAFSPKQILSIALNSTNFQLKPSANGWLAYTINNVLQPSNTYTISVTATNSGKMTSSATAAVVNVTMPASTAAPTFTSPALSLTYAATSSYNNGGVLVTPANPAGANKGNGISSGTGTGYNATLSFVLPDVAASPSLQRLSVQLTYGPLDNPEAFSLTYYTPHLPTISSLGVLTMNVQGLNGNTHYTFVAKVTYTNNLVLSTLPANGTTGGCLNSCSGHGYCHPQLLVCHCDPEHVGADCSIPMENPYWCGFGNDQQSQNMCFTWTIFNWTGYPGPLTVPSMDANYTTMYYRFRGDIDGGHFAWLWNSNLTDGHSNGVGWNVFVNTTTNETFMGVPKGLMAWNGNHAQGPSPGMWFIGYYDSVAGVTDVQWWAPAIAQSLTYFKPAANGNEYSFINLTAGLGVAGASLTASWSIGTGTMTRHSVWNRGKLFVNVADFIIIPTGNEPNYKVAYAPFIVMTSVAILASALFTVLPKEAQHKLRVSRLFQHVAPWQWSAYLMLPADQLFRSDKVKGHSSEVQWRLARRVVALLDMTFLHVRRMLGELVYADLLFFFLYCVLLIAFITNFQALYDAIQFGTDSRYVYGHVILWHLTLLVIPVTKNSVLLWLLGVPFERAVKYHRWIGKLTIIWIGVHFYTQSNYFHDTINTIQLHAFTSDNSAIVNVPSIMDWYALSWETAYGWGHVYGFAAFFIAIGLFVFSLSEVRRLSFAVFYISHLIGWPAFFVLCQLHMRWTYYFLLPGAALYALDHAVRAYNVLKHSGRAMRVELLADDYKLVRSAARVDIALGEGKWSHKPGQYAFIMIPSVSFMWHPYTISSSQYQLSVNGAGKVVASKAKDSEAVLSVHLLSMGRNTFSDAVVKIAKHIRFGDLDSPSPRRLPYVLVDGFYSTFSFDLDRFSHLVIVAGGIGVTPFFALLPELIYKFLHSGDADGQRAAPLKSIKFVWSARTSTAFKTWNRTLLDALLHCKELVEVKLFESRSSYDREYGFEMPNDGPAAALGLDGAKSLSALSLLDRSRAATPAPGASAPGDVRAASGSVDDVKKAHDSQGAHESDTAAAERSVRHQVHFHFGAEAVTVDMDKQSAAAETELATLNPAKQPERTITAAPPPASAAVSATSMLPIEKGRPEWASVFSSFDKTVDSASTAVLVCGPTGMISGVQQQAVQRNWPLHVEHFYF